MYIPLSLPKNKVKIYQIRSTSSVSASFFKLELALIFLALAFNPYFTFHFVPKLFLSPVQQSFVRSKFILSLPFLVFVNHQLKFNFQKKSRRTFQGEISFFVLHCVNPNYIDCIYLIVSRSSVQSKINLSQCYL